MFEHFGKASKCKNLKREINKFMIFVELFSIHETNRQKMSKDIDDQNNVVNQVDLTDIYRILYPKTAE